MAKAVSNGLMDEPITIHSHGGRVALLQTGELHIDVAFIGVSACDPLGNANGVTGRSHCGSLGYAMVDAEFADRNGEEPAVFGSSALAESGGLLHKRNPGVRIWNENESS